VDPTDLDVEEARALALLRRARSIGVGTVLTYDAATNRARVTVGWLGMTAQGVPDLPLILPAVTMLHPRSGGSGLFITPAPGCEVVLLIADRALDRFLVAGGPVPLESDRMHDYSDALGIAAGPSPSSKPLPAAAAVSTLLGREDGTATLALTHTGPPVATLEGASGVRLGQGATHPVVLGDNLIAVLVALGLDLAASVVPDVASAGVALGTALAANPMISTKVQTE
jgi:hypothetical protein